MINFPPHIHVRNLQEMFQINVSKLLFSPLTCIHHNKTKSELLYMQQ